MGDYHNSVRLHSMAVTIVLEGDASMKKKGTGAKAANPKTRGYRYDARTQELHWLEQDNRLVKGQSPVKRGNIQEEPKRNEMEQLAIPTAALQEEEPAKAETAALAVEAVHQVRLHLPGRAGRRLPFGRGRKR